MVRNKALWIAALTLTAAAGAFVFAGSAFGQDWYEYKGRLTAGNAYLVTVPAGAESLELALLPNGETAAATLAVFDPEDDKVAVWKLDGATSTATLANPTKGDYVVFVYTLNDGGLAIRTLADDAASDLLQIKRVGTERQDVRIATIDTPSALSQNFASPKLGHEPVFATLLYSGSAEGLTATVASPKGTVLSVADETGTAYGPGLYGSVTGTRTVFPENLASGVYTVNVAADRFEGDLFLTFASFKRGELKEIAPDPDVDVVLPDETTAVKVAPEVPTAILVPAGAGVLRFTIPHEEEETDEEGAKDDGSPPPPPTPAGPGDDGSWGGSHSWYACPSAVSVYTPDDKLLGVATFDEDFTATIPVTQAGEYVVLVRGGDSRMPVLLDMPLLGAAPKARQLGTVTDTIDLGRIRPLEGSVETVFELEQAPLMLAWRMDGGSGALFADGLFESSVGEAVRQDSLVAGGWSGWSDSMDVDLEALVDGEYTFTFNSPTAYGNIVGLVVRYDREQTLEAEEEEA